MTLVKVKINFKLGDQVRLFDGKAIGTIDSIEKEKAIVNYELKKQRHLAHSKRRSL